MGALTEIEIFECLVTNFREAAERCEQLAWNPRRGFIYLEFLRNLRLIEGACAQAGHWREDTRWFGVGQLCGNVKKYAGTMVRASRTKDERNRAVSFFKTLANHLRGFHHEAEQLRNKATGKRGLILPDVQEGPHRDTRPVQVLQPSSLILPGDPRYG